MTYNITGPSLFNERLGEWRTELVPYEIDEEGNVLLDVPHAGYRAWFPPSSLREAERIGWVQLD